jgi:hypothetical protein
MFDEGDAGSIFEESFSSYYQLSVAMSIRVKRIFPGRQASSSTRETVVGMQCQHNKCYLGWLNAWLLLG